jgi:hypothetical protein
LISHSTGILQRAISQPFEDERGHLAKFYAIYRWAYGPTRWEAMKDILGENLRFIGGQKDERTTGADLGDSSAAIKAEFLIIAKEVYESNGARRFYRDVVKCCGGLFFRRPS